MKKREEQQQKATRDTLAKVASTAVRCDYSGGGGTSGCLSDNSAKKVKMMMTTRRRRGGGSAVICSLRWALAYLVCF